MTNIPIISTTFQIITNPAAYCVVIVLAVVVKVFSVSCPEHETTMFTLPAEIRDRK